MKSQIAINRKIATLLLAALAVIATARFANAQTVTNVFFFDNFDRTSGSNLGSATNAIDGTSYLWSKGGVAPSSTIITNNTLSLGTGGVAGRDWASAQLTNTSGFNTAYSSSTASSIEWYFNMRTTRTDPSGFDAGGYGSAFVIGASSSALTNSGTAGYAIVIGQSGATDPLRLVSFANGITNNAGLTTILTATNVGADIGNQFLSLKLTLNVASSLWTLTGTTNSSFIDPYANPSMLSLGSASNSTFTSTSLSYVGAFWNHATAATDTTTFDNFRIASVTASGGGSFSDWTGGSGNWSSGFSSAVTNGASLSFSGPGGVASNDISSPLLATIVFSNSAGSYSVNGNPFSVSNGIVNNSANAQTFSNAITLGAAQSFNAAAGDMTFAGDIDNAGNVLTIAGASNSVVSGIISGAAGLTKTGSGTLTLGGANSFTGAVTLNGGVTAIDTDGRLGNTANDITFGGGTLKTTANIDMGSGRDLSGTGTLDIANGTTLTNGGAVNMTSLTLANSGTFEMNGASKTLNGLTFNTASLLTNTGAAAAIGGNITANNASGTVVMAGAYDLGAASRTITIGNGSAEVDMQMTGSISSATAAIYLVKAGTGRLELTGVNTGLTGSVQLGSAGSAPAGELLINNKDALGLGQFRLNSGTLIASTALTGANAITNSLSIGGRAANAAILGGTNAIEFTGTVGWFGAASTASTLQVNNETTLSGVISNGNAAGITFEFGGAGTLTLSGASGNTFTNSLTISNTGLTVVAGKNDAFGTSAAGTTVQSGSTVVLSNVNYSTAEQLGISGAGVDGNGALRGRGSSTYVGAVTASGNATIVADSGADLTLSGTLNGGGNTLTVGGAGNLLLSGAVSNGNISKTGAGNLTISNASSSFGTLTTGAGNTAIAASASATGLAGSGALELSGGTFTLNNSTAQTFSGAISGAGALVKTGSGSLTLSGNSSTFAGATTVTNGTLVVNGNLGSSAISVGNATTPNASVLMGSGSVGATTINNNGRISPGNSVGTLSVSNTLTLNSGGSYLWEINGTNGPAGTTWDLITIDTTATGDGLGALNLPGSGQFTVNGAAIDAFAFNGNQNYTNNYFQIIKASSFTGSTANLAFLGTGLGSGSWTFSTNASGLYLNYTAPSAEISFTNTGVAFQGDADIATPAGPWGLIDQDYAVVVNGGGTVIMTNASNSYSGTTTIKNGTLQANVDAANGADGAFGNAITSIAVGNDTGSASATLDIGADGVTVGRTINVVAGSSGTKTVGTSLNSGTATYSGNMVLDDAATLTAGGTANAVFSGVVSGAGGVSKTGSGTVTYSGSSGNSYTGTTIVSAGTLLLSKSSGNALATNVTVNSGGTLLLGASDQIAAATVTLGGGTFDLATFNDTIGTLQLNSGNLNGSGTLTAASYNLAGGTVAANLGTGTINASANAALNGTAGAATVNITGGTLTLGSAARLTGTTPTVNLSSGGALALGGNESIGTLNLTNGTVSGTGVLSVASAINAQNGTISANLGGNAGLTKTTASTVTLSGANTFSGAVAVNGGTLILTNGNALSDSSAVILANAAGAVLEIDSSETIGSLAGGGSTGGSVALDANTLTLSQSGNTAYAGTITGTGTLVKSGSGTLTFNQAGAIGADFDMVINAGTIDFNRAGSAIGVLLGTGNTIQLNGGTVGFTSSSAANGAITNGGISVTADSTILIARTSTSSHSTTISAPLSFSNSANLSFAYNSSVTGGTTTFAGANNILHSDATITQTNYSVLISGPIGETGGSRSLTKIGAGTLILNADNTYTGDTVIAGGELRLTNSASRLSDSSLLRISNGASVLLGVSDTIKGLSGGGSVSVGTGAILTTANTATDTFSGVITNAGGFAKTGSGTQIFSGANTYTGTTTVSAGSLLINGNQSGANGVLTVASGATLGGAGTIGGAVNVVGTLAPGNSIESLSTGALSFSNGSTFAVELNSSVATSVGADLAVASGGLSLDGTVTLTLNDIALAPAAFSVGTKFSLVNYSGSWNNGLFTFGAGTLADGDVFAFGLNSWQIDYNASVGGANFVADQISGNFVNIEAVPEPSTYALLGLAAAGLGAHLVRRRRR